MTKMTSCKEITEYLQMVEREEYPVCREQKLLAKMIRRIDRDENLQVDTEQLEKYMQLQKYFPFELFPWEKFVFTLHNCVYDEENQLRFSEILILVGRGAGKNGYLSFEDFALLTPVNNVRGYDIYIFANSEEQAKTSFDDIYTMLEDNKQKMSKHFSWTKEQITNKKTRSKLQFQTSNASTKDGRRPGKVDFDEYHQYEDYKMITVARTGLGKKEHPRVTIMTTNGDVRDGPLDHIIGRAESILKGEVPDNGLLPFICWLDDKKEVDVQVNWHKANPSLRYLPTLMKEMQREYADYKLDQFGNSAFMTKRMNRPAGNAEAEVTSWENIVAACGEVIDLTGYTCVAGIDYASTQDFVAAGLLFEVAGIWYWITHTWVCKQSKTLCRVKFPIEDAEQKGLLTIVDEVEIPPSMPAEWLSDKMELYDIRGLAIDKFRYTLLAKALKEVGFDTEKDGKNNVKLIRPSNIMETAPLLTSKFATHSICWGDNPLMRWYTGNAKQIIDAKGNVTYGKQEPKSRKTDGFMAFVSAACRITEIQGMNDETGMIFDEVYTY
mgnify:CR=1 FL=1